MKVVSFIQIIMRVSFITSYKLCTSIISVHLIVHYLNERKRYRRYLYFMRYEAKNFLIAVSTSTIFILY